MTGFIGQEIVPSGETFKVKNIVDAGVFAESQIPKNWSVRVNRFWIDYTPESSSTIYFATQI